MHLYGVTEGETGPKGEAEKQEPRGTEWMYAEDEIRKIAEEYNIKHDSKDEKISEEAIQRAYEKPVYATYICPDDIGVHKQKEHRKSGNQAEQREKGKTSRQYVENTVISVHTQGTEEEPPRTQYFAGVWMCVVFFWTLAFLLVNGGLREKKVIFFSDGASNIRTTAKKVFGFRPYEIYLDWFPPVRYNRSIKMGGGAWAWMEEIRQNPICPRIRSGSSRNTGSASRICVCWMTLS